MCYASPAPRCSPHALEKKQRAQVTLDQASENLNKARVACKTTQTAALEAKLRNAENEFEVAKAAFVEAKEAYDKAKEEKAVAYKKFKEEEREYRLTPDGIKELRAEGRGELADRFVAERKKRIAEAEAKEAMVKVVNQKNARAEAEIQSQIQQVPSLGWKPAMDLATSKETHPAVLEALAASSNWNVREKVAFNPHTPPSAQVILARDEHKSVRSQVASRPRLAPEAAHILVQDSPEHAFAVGINRSLDAKTLDTLAASSNFNVRLGVAGNPSTSEKTLVALSRDAESSVVFEAVKNPNISSAALAEVIEKRPYKNWWRTGDKRGNAPLWWDKRQSIMKAIGLRPDATPEVLKSLLKDKNMDVRAVAALNPNLPEQDFELQSRKGSKAVQTAIWEWKMSGSSKEDFARYIATEGRTVNSPRY